MYSCITVQLPRPKKHVPHELAFPQALFLADDELRGHMYMDMCMHVHVSCTGQGRRLRARLVRFYAPHTKPNTTQDASLISSKHDELVGRGKEQAGTPDTFTQESAAAGQLGTHATVGTEGG